MDRLTPPVRRLTFDLPGGQMAAVAFGDSSSRPADVLFLHATGFNGLSYRQLLEPLGQLGVIAPDLRGHGRTTLPAGTLDYPGWTRHRDDVIALIEKLETAVVLAGHSMGAITALLVGGKRPDLVRGLCLIDPVLMPPRFYAGLRAPGAVLANRYFLPIARKAAKRRATFASREEARDALTGRGFFKSFSAQALADYVDDGYLDAPDGSVRLACSPAYECATFAAQRHDPWAALGKAPSPMVVLRAETGSTCPRSSAERLKSLRTDARVATIEGSTHALPWERPDRTRAAIESVAVMAPRLGGYRDVY